MNDIFRQQQQKKKKTVTTSTKKNSILSFKFLFVQHKYHEIFEMLYICPLSS